LLPVKEREHIKDLLTNAWQESTRTSYAAGLLTYHAICDQKNISEEVRAPASTDLIIAFVLAMAGSLADPTINNYISAIRTWHIIHHATWNIDHVTVDTALRAATVSAPPPKSANPPWQPVTINYLTAILNHLNKNHPLDAAIMACITTTFWSVSRLGKFTVQTINSFSIKQHITTKATALDQDRNGLQVRTFKLPFTKLARGKAFQNHLHINAPLPGVHIFAYKTNQRKALTPLTKHKVIKRVRAITSANDLLNFEGHSLRIGGSLKHLLQGIPFNVVQSMGRWKSNSFQLYLHEHVQILAPYL
jgi:hypothetical protein